IEQVRAQTGRELRIDGPLNLSFLPRISLVANDVSLSGPRDFDGPDLFQADQLRLAVELWPLIRGEVETGDIALENARLVVHTDRSGRSSLDGLAGDADAGGAAPGTSTQASGTQSRPAVSTGAIALSQTRVEVSDAATDARQVFVVERLEINSFKFDSPIRFEFEGAIGEPPMVDNIDVNGTLVVPFGDGPIEVSELGMTARAAGLPMGLTGRATLNPGPPLLASFSDGVLNLDGREFQTRFSYRDGERPSIDARLQGDELDVDALLAALPPVEEAPAPESDDAESPLLLLREFDVDAQVELRTMIASGLVLTDVEARLNARNGVVTVDPLSGVLRGGRVDAVAMADLTVEPPVVQIDP
ncbi:MAG: AsmA family protein, partial [Wenzhouxiangellaceae bacterium]